ncbi:MAG: nuclear transport factor 2 family protein [Geminicoccaceae bacterium]
MAISDETLTALKHAYQTWHESHGENVGPMLEVMADDVEVTTLPDGANPLEFSKACYSKAEMTAYLQGLIGDWHLLGVDIEDMVRERDRVVVLLTTSWRNRRTDKSFESHAAHAWRFRNGYANQLRLFFDSAKWSEAARADSL